VSAGLSEVRADLSHPSYAIAWSDTSARLPLIVAAKHETPLRALDAAFKQALNEVLPRAGAIVLRGFVIRGPDEFGDFVASFGAPLMSYQFGSTPRREIARGVYTSTEYPAHRIIDLHNEQSYTRSWPSRIWFHCVKAASSGGETPLADSRAVFDAIRAPIRDAFIRNELLYVRNYGSALDVPWQRVFATDDRAEVERYCREHGIACAFDADGALHTRERCQAAIPHPVTGHWVWFNQAHLFHVSSLEPRARQNLLGTMGEGLLPRQVYFGDGTRIPEDWLAEIRETYRDHTNSVPLQSGDLLVLDNCAVAHGRNAFKGERCVHVAMT
jgi:hypothetical protein